MQPRTSGAGGETLIQALELLLPDECVGAWNTWKHKHQLSPLQARYVVANLRGNTAYLLDVRAVNKVGAGDAGEFERLVVKFRV